MKIGLDLHLTRDPPPDIAFLLGTFLLSFNTKFHFISHSLVVHKLSHSHLAYHWGISPLRKWDGLMRLPFLHSMNGMLGHKWQCGLIPMPLLRASSMIMVKAALLNFATLFQFNSCFWCFLFVWFLISQQVLEWTCGKLLSPSSFNLF